MVRCFWGATEPAASRRGICINDIARVARRLRRLCAIVKASTARDLCAAVPLLAM
jgi:hypothetical protein